MSINQLFQISRRSFQTLDAAMNVVGQNVSNADTEGYHRRRVTLAATDFVGRGIYSRSVGPGATGYGASIGSYERVRDRLLSKATWEAKSGLGYAEEKNRIMSSVEALFPTGIGSLDDQLNDFWNAWSDLADNPLGTAERLNVRSRAETFADTLNRLDADLAFLQTQTEADFTDGVDAVNDLLTRIADLNRTIAQAENQGTPDFSAQDTRDQLVNDLSEFVPVRVSESGNDGYLITINGMAVVQGEVTTPLSLDLSGSAPVLTFGDSGVTLRTDGTDDGKLGAWMSALTDDLPDARAALDEMASTLVTEINALHSGGYGLDGSTGIDFFDPSGVTAGTIRVSDDVLADANVIAASGDAAAEGDNAVALALADLRNTPLFNGGTDTAEDFAINLVSDIGAQVSTTATMAESQTGVVDYLTAIESGVSGVSIDEEMTRMIELQQAFAATARVLDTAQRMMDTLLAL